MTHRLARLPHVSKRLRRLLGPLDGLVFDGLGGGDEVPPLARREAGSGGHHPFAMLTARATRSAAIDNDMTASTPIASLALPV